jgi:hypothetical protein
MKARSGQEAASCLPPSEQIDLRPIKGREADEELTAFARAPGHPARVRISRIPARRNNCNYRDILDERELAQPAGPQRLGVREKAWLIRGQIDGSRVCHCMEPRGLRRAEGLAGAPSTPCVRAVIVHRRYAKLTAPGRAGCRRVSERSRDESLKR